MSQKELKMLLDDIADRIQYNHYINTSAKDAKVLLENIMELEKNYETLQMKLVACGVAAMQNTESSIKGRLSPDQEYYSASYQDVCNAVDREMKLESENKLLKEERRADAVDGLCAQDKAYNRIIQLEADNKRLKEEALAGQKAVEAIENLPMLRRSWGLSLEVKKIVDEYKRGIK